MNKERLLKLAALLDVVPPHQFEMSNFATSVQPMENKPICASAACVLGWATTIPEFGLELVMRRGQRSALVREVGTLVADEYAAARNAFGLEDDDVSTLFFRGFRMSPKDKAEQIRALVAAE